MSNDQWALVTGASGGIGREFALILARKGTNVILASRNAARLAGLKEEIERDGKARAEVIQADLSSPGGASHLYAECRKRGLVVDTLINNAGAGIFGRSVDIPQNEAEAMLSLNIQGLTSLCSLFGKDMEQRGKGRILNVGSIAGNQPTPYFASYAASKSYVLMYSLALREELKRSGVRVTCLEPGYVRTDFDENAKVASDRYKDFSRNHSMPAARVAAIGIRAMERGRAVTIAGFSNRVAAFFSSLVPRRALAGVLRITVERMTR
jgi:short-subunit dehydrogenase